MMILLMKLLDSPLQQCLTVDHLKYKLILRVQFPESSCLLFNYHTKLLVFISNFTSFCTAL